MIMSFAVMEDSAMPGGNMSAITDFREAVFRHCLFFVMLPPGKSKR